MHWRHRYLNSDVGATADSDDGDDNDGNDNDNGDSVSTDATVGCKKD